MRRKAPLIALGFAITLLFALHVMGHLKIPLLNMLEFATYDARVRLSTTDQIDPRIVIIDIDERSLEAEGRWPWRRDKIGTLVERLVDDYQVEIVAFDMVFAEKDENFSVGQLRELAMESADQFLIERLASYEPHLDRDLMFARSIASTGRVVLGYYFHHSPNQTGQVGAIPPPLYAADTGMALTTYAIQANGHAANLAILQENALTGGFFSNPVVDEDGVYRRVPMLVEYQGDLYAALALATVQAYLGLEAEPVFAPGSENPGGYPALEALDLAGARIPLDANGVTLVPYRGAEGSFPYVSATDVLNGTVEDPGQLAGTIALVGTTAAGLLDLRPTPVQNVYPGVEVHANLMVGIMDGTIKHQPAYTIAMEFLSVVGIGLLLAMVLPVTGPLLGGFITLLILGAMIGANVWAWNQPQHVLPTASTLSLVALLYVVNVVYGFFFESRTRNQLGRLFGQYVPPELVDEMSRDPAAYSLEGEKRELTVLFSDVRNFTVISESMDPQELTRMMNAFLTPMTRAVHLNKGTIDKYMGDAMMAFWGAPVADPEHADHAVKAALEMVSIIDALQATFRAEGWAEIRVGIGLNSGEMSVGNMGSEFRIAYTVMGDAVNLGSRLEGLTKQYGVPILVSEYTVALATGHRFVELDEVRVKGKAQPVSIHAPLCAREHEDEQPLAFLEGHATALSSYRARQFAEARLWFAEKPPIPWLQTVYDIYLQRIDLFLEDPPPENWDGVFDFKTK